MKEVHHRLCLLLPCIPIWWSKGYLANFSIDYRDTNTKKLRWPIREKETSHGANQRELEVKNKKIYQRFSAGNRK